MKKEFYIVVPYDQNADSSVRETGMVGLFRSFWSSITSEESITSIRSNHRRTDELRKGNMERLTTIKGSLESVGLRSEEVDKDGLVRLLYDYYNPRVNGEQKLRESVDKMGLS